MDMNGFFSLCWLGEGPLPVCVLWESVENIKLSRIEIIITLCVVVVIFFVVYGGRQHGSK